MIWLELLVAFVVALLLTWTFVGGFGWRRPGTRAEDGVFSALGFFFLLVFLATWAGGVWIRPFGPSLHGVSWLGFVVVGLLTALLLSSATRPLRRIPDREARSRGWLAGAGVVFWTLLLLLLIAGVTAAFDPMFVSA